MFKRILSLVVICSFLITQPSAIMAQSFNPEGIASELRLTSKDKIIPKEEGYEKFTCPSCKRQFEIKVNPEDLVFERGLQKITCPYDGTEFYPQSRTEEMEQEIQYETIKCPTCGKEFKGYVDIKAILRGESQLLVCPYEKKNFYFKAEAFKPAALKLANMQTVICPVDKRTFRAYIDFANPKELTCPYDGTRFFPTPESIVLIPGRDTLSLSETMPQGFMNVNGVMQPFMGQQQSAGGMVSILPEDKPSRIEAMFFEHIPLYVSTTIKQFGYDIFKPVEKVGPETETKSQKGTGESQGGDKLLKSLLGAKKQTDAFFGESSTEGGFSIFNTPTEIASINDYILGPGDVLRISIWGQIQDVFFVTIDSEGIILLPKVGPLYLWGLKFSEAENLIKENLLKAYTNIQMNVSISKLRSIKVFVLGEAEKPGAYTISSLSNAFHAIYAAGGPTKLGSLRKIKLVRKGNPEMPIDLYKILLEGENAQDYKLQSGDTIFIPPIGDVVGIAGNVKRPAIYELNEKIKLNDLMEMAGGLSSVGYVQRIQLERIQDHLRKTVLDLEFKSLADLKDSPNNLSLQDGDLILIFPINSIRYNFVSINGSILRPGDYELKGGMRLKDLIDKAGGALPGTYLKRAEIARFKGDQTREVIPFSLAELMDGKEEVNINLKEWDIVTIYSKEEVLPTLFVEVEGAVNKPGPYELTENMKISDLIFRAGGLKRNAAMSRAELFRSFYESGTKTVNIDLNEILSKDTEEANKNDLSLEEGDYLFVREDVNMGEKTVVILAGEFKYPGKYAVEKGTTLSEVIKRAGGFTKGAFLDGCVYTRESVRVAQQKMINNFLDAEQKALLQEESSMAVGMTPVQVEARDKLIEYRRKLVEKLERTGASGRILIQLNADLDKFTKSEYNVVVEDGDVLQIPVPPSTVQVVGNVYGQGVITFSEGKGIDYYINKVGGLTKYGDANRIFIIRANGETISSFVRAVKVKRGDTIVVPEEFKYKTLPGLVFKDLIQVLYQAALGAAVTITAINSM